MIREEYKKWLIDLTYNWCKKYGSYRKLMEALYSRNFVWDILNDENRAADGEDFRLRFAEKNEDYTYRDVKLYLDHPCNVLEMMAALATRCEEHIMGDPDSENNSWYWFYDMLKNMHMDHMTDNYFDQDAANEAIDRMLYREYEPDGDGGLFYIPGIAQDMRSVEIWYQLNWYLSERNN